MSHIGSHKKELTSLDGVGAGRFTPLDAENDSKKSRAY